MLILHFSPTFTYVSIMYFIIMYSRTIWLYFVLSAIQTNTIPGHCHPSQSNFLPIEIVLTAFSFFPCYDFTTVERKYEPAEGHRSCYPLAHLKTGLCVEPRSTPNLTWNKHTMTHLVDLLTTMYLASINNI